MDQEWPAKRYLKTLKEAIDRIRPHKGSDIEMRFCAQTLAGFFREITKKPLYEIVGLLLVSAFNWSRGQRAEFSWDLRLAALQRAKGPSINARRSTLQEALDLQNQDYTFWREREGWISDLRDSTMPKASNPARRA
jgi:hypothetical protein